MSTPILPFAVWASGTNQNSIPANDNAMRAEILQRNVNNSTTAQPGSPSDGDTYIIQATHTGAQWSTFDPDDLAIYKGGAWYAFAPVNGVRVTVGDAIYVYASGAWIEAAGSGGGGGVSDTMTVFGDVDVPKGYNLTKKGVVIQRGAASSWKESRVESPQVFWDPKIGKYRMVFLGYSGTPSSPSVASLGYATSNDLETWTEYGSNPFFTRTTVDGDPDENGTSAPFVWYEDGVYYLFYLGLTETGLESGNTSICLATSTDFSTWTRLGAIIEPLASTWRASKVWHPNVVKRGSTYYLFFNASDGTNSGLYETIGYATSTNLTTWTVDDANSPILDIGSSGQWDDVRVGDPFVYRIRDTWYMVYYANDGTLSQNGIATTSDADFPLGWAKYPSNPVLAVGASGAFDDKDAARAGIWITPNRYFHWYTTNDGSSPALVEIAVAVDYSLAKVKAPGSYIGCRAYNDGTQSIPNNSSTAITFGAEEWDTSSIHSTSSNTSRFTVPQGMNGKWRFTWHLTYATNATGLRISFLRKNGGSDSNNIIGSVSQVAGNASFDVGAIGTACADLVAGDYIEVFVYQTSGGSLNVGSTVAADRGKPNTMEAEFLG